MDTEKESIDSIIRDALSQEEAAFYDSLEEQNLFQMVGGLFQGKLKWLLWLMNIVMVLMFAAFVYCLVQFFNTDDTQMLIKWGLAATFSMMSVSLLKLFGWMQMDKNSILREVKRLELQVSILASKLSQ